MAISWSSYRSVSGPVNFRVGIDITYSPTSISASTASVTVTTRIYLGASGSAFASGGSWSASGSDSGSGSGVSWSIGSGGGSDLIATLTETVTLAYGSTKSFTINATIRPSGSWPGSVSHSRTITLPARPISAPSAPTGVSVARSSDTRQTVSWSVTSTDARPVTKHRITRSVNGATWQTVANLSGSARSWVDANTASGNVYRYNVVAGNSAGEAVGSPSAVTVSTTPARPAAPSATKNAAGDIIITRPALSPSATTWAVGEHNAATLATGIPVSQSTWRFENPSTAKTWRFTVLATSSTPTLNSAWSLPSNTVQLLAPPLAPSNLSPSGTAVDATQAQTFTFRHNPVDETPQAFYQVRHRRQGGTWVEELKQLSSTSSWVLPADTYSNGAPPLEWQVRTWGQHADPGPWSATAVVQLSSPPVADITSPAPGSVWPGSRVTLDWTFHDPEGSSQTAWKVALLTDGSQVDSQSGSWSLQRRTTLAATVEDGREYTATLQVRDGSGMWSQEVSSTFTVEYALPPVPSGQATWHRDEGYVTLTVDVGDPAAGEVPAAQLAVYRATGDRWVLVEDGLAPGQTITDMIPSVGGVVTYRVAAVSDLPSTSWSTDIVVATPTDWVFLNYGPGFGQVVRLWANLSAPRTAGRVKALHQLAGLDYPVERAGRARTRTYTLQASVFGADVPDESSTWEEIEVFAEEAAAPVLLRDPAGTRMFVSVGELSVDDSLAEAQRVTIPLARVSWPEDGVVL